MSRLCLRSFIWIFSLFVSDSRVFSSASISFCFFKVLGLWLRRQKSKFSSNTLTNFMSIFLSCSVFFSIPFHTTLYQLRLTGCTLLHSQFWTVRVLFAGVLINMSILLLVQYQYVVFFSVFRNHYNKPVGYRQCSMEEEGTGSTGIHSWNATKNCRIRGILFLHSTSRHHRLEKTWW